MTLPGISSLLRLSETDSTQSVARYLAEQGAADKTLVWADRQTRGRGRMARRWSSPVGGIYISLILRPQFPPKCLAELSLKTAASVAAAISDYTGIQTMVKAPNDVLGYPHPTPLPQAGEGRRTSLPSPAKRERGTGRRRRPVLGRIKEIPLRPGRVRAKKICGILAEASGGSKKIDWLVVGVGINVNNKPPLPTSASLKSLTGKSWDIEIVLRRFLEKFNKAYLELNQ